MEKINKSVKWNNIKWLKVAWYGKNGNRIVNSRVSSETAEPQQRCIYRGRSIKIWQMEGKGVSHQVVKSEWAESAEALELYCERLSKESAGQGDVREGVKESVGAEVKGVRDVRWNRVSPDIYPPLREWHPDMAKGKMGWSQRLQFQHDRVLLGVSGGSPSPVPGHGCYPKVPMSYIPFWTSPI